MASALLLLAPAVAAAYLLLAVALALGDRGRPGVAQRAPAPAPRHGDLARAPVRHFPSRSHNHLIIAPSPETSPQAAAAFAREVSALGVAHTYLLHAGALQVQGSGLVAALRARSAGCPIFLAECSPEDGIRTRAARADGAFGDLPPRRWLRARDGAQLAYRRFGEPGGASVVLLHGAGAHGDVYAALAQILASRVGSAVYVPDLRGHHRSAVRPGDVAYIGQLEDDLEDLVGLALAESPGSRVVLMAHSAGAGLALRYAGRARRPEVAGYVLLAPYLGLLAPATRSGAGGEWARAYWWRTVGLAMLSGAHVNGLNHLPSVEFRHPALACDAAVTRRYSYRLWASLSPRPGDVRAVCAGPAPVLLLVGAEDEVFAASAYERLRRHAGVRVEIIPGASHLGVVFHPRAVRAMAGWIGGRRTAQR